MPLKSQLHVDRLLSNVSVKYRNQEYVGDRVFPMMPVKKSTDLYRVYDREFRLPETYRAPKGVAREHSFDVSTASYQLERHALKDYVADSDKDNYDIADLRSDTVEELTDVILRRMEKSVMDLFTTTNWSLNVSLAAANAWNANTTVSNPIPIVDTGASTIINNSGMRPNFALMNNEAYIAVKNHVSVLDRIKYVSMEVSEKMIAALFDVKELLVSRASYDSSAKGATSSITALLGDTAFLGYKPPRPSPLKPSSGYLFKRDLPMVKRWRVEERDSEAIEVNMEYQPKVVASLAGYLVKDVI